MPWNELKNVRVRDIVMCPHLINRVSGFTRRIIDHKVQLDHMKRSMSREPYRRFFCFLIQRGKYCYSGVLIHTSA